MTAIYVSGTKVSNGAPIYALNGQDLFILPGAELIGNDDPAVTATASSLIQVDGSVYASGGYAFQFTGPNNALAIGPGGVVSGSTLTLIYIADGFNVVRNAGYVFSQFTAINANDIVLITNSGAIDAGTAIELVGGRVVNTGAISAQGTAIRCGDVNGESTTITNVGVITAGSYCIAANGTGALRVLNSGQIMGDIRGGDGGDKIDTRRGDVDGAIELGTGADTVLGGTSVVDAFGEAGDDLLRGGGGNDLLDGGLDNDMLRGLAGDDVLLGGDGVDRVYGGDGDDWAEGGVGNDLISGDRGDDTLAGGKNSDTFMFRAGFGHDLVLDFKDQGNDLMRFSRDLFINYSDLQDHMRQAGTDVLIAAEDGSTIVLAATSLASLTAADFVFG
jgi:Ca2+-binding RTX toxin-like protein